MEGLLQSDTSEAASDASKGFATGGGGDATINSVLPREAKRPTPERPLTSEEAAAFVRVHPRTVKRMARAGKVPGHFRWPNLWRVMVGDRIIWISGVEAQDKNPTRTLVAFGDNALVYGERHVHPNDIAWFLSFGAPVEGTPNERVLTQVRSGLDDVRKLGLPDEIADIACGWRLGS